MPDNNEKNISIVESNINLFDLFVLLVMWALVVITSVIYIGIWPAIIFVLLNTILVARNTYNGILVMILIFFSPSISLAYLPLGPFVISFILIVFKYFVIDFVFIKRSLNMNIVSTLAIIYVVYIAATVAFSPDIDLALKYYQKYIEGLIVLLVVFGVVNGRRELGVILKWWAIAASLSLLIKLLHVYLGSDTALFNLLKSVDVASKLIVDHKLNINIGGDTSRRILWPGEEPNYSSANLIFPFAIALGLFAVTRGWVKWAWALASLMIASSVIGSFSRSGFIALTFVLIVFALKYRNVIAFIALGLFSSVILVLFSTIPILRNRLFGIGDEIQGDGSGRYELWAQAIDLWVQSPVWGNGFASYYYYGHAAHNTFLQILAEAGVIGLTIFVSLILSVVVSVFKYNSAYVVKAAEDSGLSKVLLLGFIGMTMVLGTVSYQDIKEYWIVCAILYSIYVVSEKNPGHLVASKNNFY